MSTQHADDNQSDAPAYKDPETLRRLYWEEEQSRADIGDKYGVAPNTIGYWMDKYDIERRDAADASTKKRWVDRVTLYLNSRGRYVVASPADDCKNINLARLIAVAEYGFDSVCDNHVHHKNEIPWDDRPENLELMAPSEHTRHHHSGKNGSKGGDNGQSKLTEAEVGEILSLLNDSGLTQYDIADEYGVDQTTISAISTGRLWPHISGGDPND